MRSAGFEGTPLSIELFLIYSNYFHTSTLTRITYSQCCTFVICFLRIPLSFHEVHVLLSYFLIMAYQ